MERYFKIVAVNVEDTSKHRNATSVMSLGRNETRRRRRSSSEAIRMGKGLHWICLDCISRNVSWQIDNQTDDGDGGGIGDGAVEMSNHTRGVEGSDGDDGGGGGGERNGRMLPLIMVGAPLYMSLLTSMGVAAAATGVLVVTGVGSAVVAKEISNQYERTVDKANAITRFEMDMMENATMAAIEPTEFEIGMLENARTAAIERFKKRLMGDMMTGVGAFDHMGSRVKRSPVIPFLAPMLVFAGTGVAVTVIGTVASGEIASKYAHDQRVADVAHQERLMETKLADMALLVEQLDKLKRVETEKYQDRRASLQLHDTMVDGGENDDDGDVGEVSLMVSKTPVVSPILESIDEGNRRRLEEYRERLRAKAKTPVVSSILKNIDEVNREKWEKYEEHLRAKAKLLPPVPTHNPEAPVGV